MYYFKLLWVYSFTNSLEKVLQTTIKICTAVRNLPLRLKLCGRASSHIPALHWSCSVLEFSSAVQWCDFQCQVRSPCSEFRSANLQFKSEMFACSECVLELACSWLCIVKVCTCITIWFWDVTCDDITLKLLHCAMKQFLRCNISVKVSRRPDFCLLVITGEISYVFLYLSGAKNASL